VAVGLHCVNALAEISIRYSEYNNDNNDNDCDMLSNEIKDQG